MAGSQQEELILPCVSPSNYFFIQILLVVGVKFFELKTI
jgi:hypothetical protein